MNAHAYIILTTKKHYSNNRNSICKTKHKKQKKHNSNNMQNAHAAQTISKTPNQTVNKYNNFRFKNMTCRDTCNIDIKKHFLKKNTTNILVSRKTLFIHVLTLQYIASHNFHVNTVFNISNA